MKKQTILYVLLIFLIVSNGFFLVHYLGKSGKKGHKSESFITKKLNFSEKQMVEFNSISDLHFDKMQSISKDIRSLKQAMFSKISDSDVPEPYLDSIADLIALQEKKKEIEVFKHLQKVRKICNAEQKERFTKIVGDAIKKHGRRGKRKKRD